IAKNKHLFIEKPVTQTPDEAAQLSQLSQEKGVMIQVGRGWFPPKRVGESEKATENSGGSRR
ncbi:MAG: Gfo/Idh/MocA family oxidoreductase, partial [Moorea sp. SIO2B7]|nr:Gfo/Idh/MocA family oxidoreductase [Moorena sp. SIO2B7]